MNGELGLIHLYCGDGKGKTTAAIGLSVRAAGRGLRVLIAQFLKSADTGELYILNGIDNITVLRNEKAFPFTNTMNHMQKLEIAEIHNRIFKTCVCKYENLEYDIIIFDELVSAYNLGLIDKQWVDSFLDRHDKKIEIVITGRKPPEEWIKKADYVSDIEKIKHPYDKNIPARRGIEV